MHKYKKLLVIILSSTLIIAVLIVIISSIAKYLVKKYDEKWTGRQITMDRTYINPFTGYIHLSNLKIYEFKSDSIFFSADGLRAKISILKLFSKTYEIRKLTLYHPRGTIIQNKKELNFKDLIDKFSSKDNSGSAKSKSHFNILRIKIIDGEFYFHEKLIPINYFIKNVNIESTGKRWDADTIAAHFSLSSGIGSGDMKGDFTINIKTNDYRLAIIIHKFDLNIIEQYLKDLTNYGSFSANLDADLKTTGTFSNVENVTNSGMIVLNDFHFGKNPGDDYVSFDKLVLAINEMSPKRHKYFYDSISVNRPYLKYERYDYLDNLQTMFGKEGANIAKINADPSKFNLVIEIVKYIRLLSRNFFQSHFKINRLAIYYGEIKFNDYSLSEKFSLELNPLSVIADSIDKDSNRVSLSLKSGIKPYGNLSVALSINPKDSSDFDLQYHFQKLPVAMFNPYIISYTSFPLDRGTLEFKGNWNVRNGMIKSKNHLVILDPRTSKRVRNKDTKWIPMPLVMTFLRERGNVIDYEIPITGNLKDPKFHLNDAIFDLLGNIFVKPATIPYGLEVKNAETEIEKSLTLKWKMRCSALLPAQGKFIEKMADFLLKNPDAIIDVYPQQYAIKEKEYILFFEAKKKYFLMTSNKKARPFSEEDSAKVDNMSVKDSLFVHYLNKHITDPLIFSIQEKCTMIIDSSFVNAKFEQLIRERKKAFNFYFKEKKVEKQFNISLDKNMIPYNGFSFYKIQYKGEFPEPLIKAYEQMNDLNNEAPRKKFKQYRKKNESAIRITSN
ncbi:MAG: DUF748 domain-containing protein [Kaistella sp.]